jgi:two-component system chemotaxis response regulator CheY
MSILVVDDSAMLRKQVGGALRRAGFDVVEAADGRTALDIVRAAADITCVICDVNMPWMTGVEFVEELAKLEARPPVLMLTSESKPDLVERAMAAGAIGWLTKPCNPEHVVATARKLSQAGAR